MNPMKSPYDMLLERMGLQYGNPTTPVNGPQDMMAEMIAAGHPIQRFKEGKKAVAKMAPGAVLPDTTHTPLLQQGKDRLKQMGQNILDAHARQQALSDRAFEPGSITKVRDREALGEIANNMLAGPLGFMPAGIVKQKGGNWLHNDDLDFLVDSLKGDIQGSTTKENEIALNKWIQSNLTNYIKNQMGTQEDPIRALAERGISHLPQNNVLDHVVEQGLRNRLRGGFPVNVQSQHPLAQQWENIADASIKPLKAELFQKPYGKEADKHFSPNLYRAAREESPWLQKLDPNTNVHTPTASLEYDTGFSHILDVLNHELNTGILRPEQLNRISASDAVMRAHLFDQEMAKKMAKEKLQAQTEMPVHKDYGDAGYKWYELKHPTNDDITKQALEYEGNTMGHCVGGYCPSVLSGRSKIYSLRDAKGEPHVTIETQTDRNYPSIAAKMKLNGASDDEIATFMSNPPQQIVQIKGKQNAAPKEDYLPYVQDFVKSGNWHGQIGDYRNAGLIDTTEALPSVHLGDAINKLNGRRYITLDEFKTLTNGGDLPPVNQ